MNFIEKGPRTFYFFVKESWAKIGMSGIISSILSPIKAATNWAGITKPSGASVTPLPLPVPPPPAPSSPAAGGGRRKKGRRAASRKKNTRRNRRGSRRNRRNTY